jgi:hypothetical protein
MNLRFRPFFSIAPLALAALLGACTVTSTTTPTGTADAGTADAGSGNDAAATIDGSGGNADAGNGDGAVDNDDYVYATEFDDGLRPTLILSAFGPNMMGSYEKTNSDAEFKAIGGVGFGQVSGTVRGVFAGDTLTGEWFEPAYEAVLVQRECNPAKDGFRVHGRFEIRFSADRKTFEGKSTTCDGDPAKASGFWKGTLTGRKPRR